MPNGNHKANIAGHFVMQGNRNEWKNYLFSSYFVIISIY